MNREEAIKVIVENCYFNSLVPGAEEALATAIKTLKQEPCEDCVSRQAVLERINDWWGITSTSGEPTLCDYIRELPSVTPQPKTGKWILTDDDFVYCSECEDSYYPRPIDASWYYCPNCGAEMEVEE